MEKLEDNVKDIYEQLDMIMDVIYDVITITDNEGVFINASRSCEKNFAISKEDLIGKSYKYLEDIGIFSESVTGLVLKNKEQVTIIQTTKANKQLLVTGIPKFDDNGDLYKIINVSRDITEIENLKDQLKKTQQVVEWFKCEYLKRDFFVGELVSNSDSMRRIYTLINQIADLDVTLLITGETGTGKGFLVKNIHNLSNRKNKEFVQINCAAIPESLIESELFGYEKGAFTGASNSGKKGLFEIAKGGTVFLDEIGDIPLSLQAKLLTVIEEKKAYRIGGSKEYHVDARIIAATNLDLENMVEEGKFRKDLFYRLNIIPIIMPPLRERLEDIPALCKLFNMNFNKKYNLVRELSEEVYDFFLDYSWPGNIRELENLLERAIITSDTNVITIDFIKNLLNKGNTKKLAGRGLKDLLYEYEKEILIKAKEKYKTTRNMAKILEVDQSTIVRKLNRYGDI